MYVDSQNNKSKNQTITACYCYYQKTSQIDKLDHTLFTLVLDKIIKIGLSILF
jgi:hypothetical protein